jgi:hypothetical protein
MLKTTLNVGRYPIEIEATKAEHFFLLCSLFADVPDRCGNCNSDNIFPHGEKKHSGEDDWTFCSIRCRDCEHQLRFGRRRDGQFYLKKDEGWHPPFRLAADGGNRGSVPSEAFARREDDARSYSRRDQAIGRTYRPPGTPPSSLPDIPMRPVDDEDDIPFDARLR